MTPNLSVVLSVDHDLVQLYHSFSVEGIKIANTLDVNKLSPLV